MIGDQVFLLESAVKENDRLSYRPDMSFETEPCKADPKHARHQRRSRPLRVIAPVRPRSDFQWTHYNDCIVSARVKAVMVESAISGVAFREVETFTTAGDRFATHELYELVVTGWGGMAPASSGVTVIEECPFCRRRVFSRFTDPGRMFDLERWDGTDIFLIWPLPKFIFAMGSVRDLLARNGFSGVGICPITTVPMHPLITTLTPGSIADWFDGARVQELSRAVEDSLGK